MAACHWTAPGASSLLIGQQQRAEQAPHSAVRRQLIVSNPIKTLLFPTRLPQKNRAPGFETRKVAAQVGGEISDTIYLHLRLAIYVRNLDLKHKSFG